MNEASDTLINNIHSSKSIHKELGQNKPIKTIEILYEGYNFLTKDTK